MLYTFPFALQQLCPWLEPPHQEGSPYKKPPKNYKHPKRKNLKLVSRIFKLLSILSLSLSIILKLNLLSKSFFEVKLFKNSSLSLNFILLSSVNCNILSEYSKTDLLWRTMISLPLFYNDLLHFLMLFLLNYLRLNSLV